MNTLFYLLSSQLSRGTLVKQKKKCKTKSLSQFVSSFLIPSATLSGSLVPISVYNPEMQRTETSILWAAIMVISTPGLLTGVLGGHSQVVKLSREACHQLRYPLGFYFVL